MPNCRNCDAHNPAGATLCHRCHIPGDFGQAPSTEARVVAPALVDCRNCGGHAPAQAAHCPSCRWPLEPQYLHHQAQQPITLQQEETPVEHTESAPESPSFFARQSFTLADAFRQNLRHG